MSREVGEVKFKRDLVQYILEEFERREYTVGDVEDFMRQLKRAIERNSEQLRKQKPFAICKNKNYLL